MAVRGILKLFNRSEEGAINTRTDGEYYADVLSCFDSVYAQ